MITPEAIARAYVSCVEMEERLQAESPGLADQIGELRGELHALLMQVFRESGIAFTDRADTARIAFNLTRPSTVQPH